MFDKLFYSTAFFLLLNGFVIAQGKQDTIHWKPNYKLKWEDFQGSPDDNVSIAVCSSSIIYKYTLRNGKGYIFTVKSVFYKKKSWAKMKIVDSNTLIHEQGHFDIAEVYARKLFIELSNTQPDAYSIKEVTQSRCDFISQERKKIDELYDLETLHGADHFKQRQWNEKIRQMLIDNKR